MNTHTTVRLRGQRPEHWAALEPDRPAIVHPTGTLTCRSWNTAADRLADALARRYRHGDAAAVALPVCAEWFVVNLALAKLGWTHVALPAGLPVHRLRGLLTASGAAVLFAGEPAAYGAAGVPVVVCPPGAVGGVPGAGGSTTGHADLAELIRTGSPVSRHSQAEPPMVLHTSGTTGTPQRVVRARPPTAVGAPDRRLAEYLSDVSGAMPVGPRSRTLLTVPVHHGAGAGFAVRTLSLAGTVFLPARDEPLAVLRLVDRERITHWATTPWLLRRMRQLPIEDLAAFDVSCLEAIVVVGGEIPSVLRSWADDCFGPDQLSGFYGATEVGVVASTPPRLEDEHPGSCGRPHRHVEVRVVDEHGVDVPTGTEGELLIRTPLSAAASAVAPAGDGFRRVGDIGRLDADGYLYVVGRGRDVIRRGGQRIHASAVERVLAAVPGVLEAAVVGLPDGATEQEIVAFCETGDRAVAPGALAGALADLPAGWRPQRVELLPTLPRNGTGKVVKAILRRGDAVRPKAGTSSWPRQPVADGGIAGRRRPAVPGSGWYGRAELDRAWRLVRREATADLIPQPERYREMALDWARVRDALQVRLRNGQYRPERPRVVPVPKTALVHRPVPVIDPVDRVVYTALAEALHPTIRATLGPQVFGVRAEDPTGLAWLDFEAAVRQLVRSTAGAWTVATDVVGFAENVRVGRLLADLRDRAAPADVVDQLDGLLRGWSGCVDGLPHDQRPSALLGAFHLVPADEVLCRAGVAFVRFQDDILLCDPSRDRLTRALFAVENELRGRGLSLSAGKTVLRPGPEALATLVARSNSASGLFDRARSSPLERARELRFALGRLTQAGDPYAAEWALEHWARVPFLSAVIGRYLAALVPRVPALAARLADRLTGEVGRAHPFALLHALRALEFSRSAGDVFRELCRALLADAGAEFFLRQQAARWLGRHGDRGDASRLIQYAAEADDPWLAATLRTAARRCKDPSGVEPPLL